MSTASFMVDVDLQSITFYPNLLEDEWTRHVGRFKPYLSATIDQEKSTRVEMSQDIAKGLDFTSAGVNPVTIPLNDTLRGLMCGPEDKEFQLELWHDRTFVADRMVGLASMPMSYLLQMASAAGGSQTQPGAISAGLPGVNVPQSTATGMAGTQGVVQEQQGRLLLTQPFAFNLQPAERYAAKFNSARQGGMGGVGTGGGSNLQGGTAGTMGQSSGMLGPGGAPPGICRVICTIRMYEVHPDWRQQQGAAAPMGAGVVQQKQINQHEFLQQGETVGPAAGQAMGGQQQAGYGQQQQFPGQQAGFAGQQQKILPGQQQTGPGTSSIGQQPLQQGGNLPAFNAR